MRGATARELFGTEVALIQAPIGSATCPELAAAVCNAGALGMLALSWQSLSEVVETITRTRCLTSEQFGANLVLEWPQEDRLLAILDAGVGVTSTFWGDPSDLVPLVHSYGALHLHSVGSVDEARRASDAGVDVIIAQGVEAGGHVRGTTPLRELLPAVLEAVDPLPVFAAGGIATGADAAGWAATGAAGVWVGTRFLCSAEARVHSRYQAAILAAGMEATYLGEVFTKGWEAAPHRVLRNSTVQRWLEAGSPGPGHRPGENDVVAWMPDGSPVQRYSDVIPLPGCTGETEALALYAGTSSAAVNVVQTAGEIVAEFREYLGRGSRAS